MDLDRMEIINTINKCFGDFGWSFSISNVSLDYIDDNRSGNYSAGASALVRVQRADGIFREALGYGGSFGSIKAEVISKAKKEAVSDGLKGAAVNFGGDVARSINHCQAPIKKTVDVTSLHNRVNLVPPTISQAPSKSSSVAGNIIDVQVSAHILGNRVPSLAPLVSSPIGAQKHSPASIPLCTSPVLHKAPPRVTPIPRVSPPLAMPLPQASVSSANQLSEEELAKIERKRRQRQQQEEFRQKHLLEQVQAQSKASEKQPQAAQVTRTPLKEQQLQQSSNSNANNNGNCANTLDVDDDVLLSTQDMEAVVQIAANNTNISRRSPMISSPSHSRSSVSDVIKSKPRLSTGHKRPDMSNYAFNTEKKPRGMP